MRLFEEPEADGAPQDDVPQDGVPQDGGVPAVDGASSSSAPPPPPPPPPEPMHPPNHAAMMPPEPMNPPNHAAMMPPEPMNPPNHAAMPSEPMHPPPQDAVMPLGQDFFIVLKDCPSLQAFVSLLLHQTRLELMTDAGIAVNVQKMILNLKPLHQHFMMILWLYLIFF